MFRQGAPVILCSEVNALWMNYRIMTNIASDHKPTYVYIMDITVKQKVFAAIFQLKNHLPWWNNEFQFVYEIKHKNAQIPKSKFLIINKYRRPDKIYVNNDNFKQIKWINLQVCFAQHTFSRVILFTCWHRAHRGCDIHNRIDKKFGGSIVCTLNPINHTFLFCWQFI